MGVSESTVCALAGRAGPARLPAAELMTTEFLAFSADVTVVSAWQTLLSVGCSHAVVTDRDRCTAVLDERLLSLAWSNGAVETKRRLSTAFGDLAPSTVLADTDVQDIAILMASEDVDAVAVVDRDGAPVGLVRSADLVAAVARLGLAGE